MTEFRDELRYTREYELAKEENGRIVVGITDYAQEQLGDIVEVEGGPGQLEELMAAAAYRSFVSAEESRAGLTMPKAFL